MTRPPAQRDDPLSWGGGWSPAVPRGRCGRYGAYCLPSIRLDSNPTPFFFLRSTTRTVVHPEVNAGHVFFLSGCTLGPTAERCVERAARMASPPGVDHGARTKCHGCRERSPASSGTFFRVQCPDGVVCVGGLFFEGFVLRHARASSS